MASFTVIKDAGETLVSLLRAGISSDLVNPDDIFLANEVDLRDLSESSLAGPAITVYLHTLDVDYKLRNNPTDPGLPLNLSYMITPWLGRSGRDGIEAQILARVILIMQSAPVVDPEFRCGDSWGSLDTLQLVPNPLSHEDRCRLWEALRLPYRLSMNYMAQVFEMQ